jgi:predicted CopG family antitoxin
MKNRTTIQLPREVRKELSELRKYERETYSEIIKRLINKKQAKKKVKDLMTKGKY